MKLLRIWITENDKTREISLKEIEELEKQGYVLEVKLVRKEIVKNILLEIETKKEKRLWKNGNIEY